MTSPVSPSLPALRQLLNEATPEARLPWSAVAERVYSADPYAIADTHSHDDAALIAAAVSSLPALLDRLERQAAAIEAVQELAKAFALNSTDGLRYMREAQDSGSDYSLVRMHRGAALAWNAAANCLDTALSTSGITPTTEEKSTDER